MAALRVGITGLIGFVGTHLRDRLAREEDIVVPPFEDEYFDDPAHLRDFVANCDVIVHLAAMNRGEPDEIYQVNLELVNKLVSRMEAAAVRPHVIFSSSTQIDLDNPYGKSKQEGARRLRAWAEREQAPLSILIIPNVFGDSGRPYYNSVVATFCHQLTHGEQPQVTGDKTLDLIYVQELAEIVLVAIRQPPTGVAEVRVPATCQIEVSGILGLLERFKDYYFDKRIVPRFTNRFEENLYRTFLTYMPDADFAQHPTLHADDRGSLFEVVKQEGAGQVFFSTTRPGITRGNHYHTRKLEKFCVVQGQALIRMRRIGGGHIKEYRVSGDQPAVVEMPIFHTHNITNIGDTDMLTLFWTNELFDPEDPDTFYEDV
ncbi:MAG: NAD-dependent epimerase/dehydratase family protein [Planctomycetota bacterium]